MVKVLIDSSKYKLYKATIRHYWKYTYVAWTQPVLTSNDSDTFIKLTDPKLSGSTIDTPSSPTWGTAAVSRFTDVYKPMNSSTTDYWTINSGNRVYSVIDMEFLDPIKITKIYVNGTVVSGYASALTGSIIYNMTTGSPVYVSHTTTSNTATHTYSSGVVFKKIRICLRPNTDGGSYPSRITEITITGTRQTITKGTSSSYDYYTDDVTYHVLNS